MNIHYGLEVSYLIFCPIESLTSVPNRLIRGHAQGYSTKTVDSPGSTVVKNLPANAGDMGSSPGLGRFHMLRSN